MIASTTGSMESTWISRPPSKKAFMTMAFGGPHSYTGKNMRDAHGAMVARGLNDIHFDAIAENLELTLNELGVAPALIDQVIATVETTRSDVLCR